MGQRENWGLGDGVLGLVLRDGVGRSVWICLGWETAIPHQNLPKLFMSLKPLRIPKPNP